MRNYEQAIAQAKVTEGMSVFNEVVAELVKGGKESLKTYLEETERLWEAASPWEKIGLARRYQVIELAEAKLSMTVDDFDLYAK